MNDRLQFAPQLPNSCSDGLERAHITPLRASDVQSTTYVVPSSRSISLRHPLTDALARGSLNPTDHIRVQQRVPLASPRRALFRGARRKPQRFMLRKLAAMHGSLILSPEEIHPHDQPTQRL